MCVLVALVLWSSRRPENRLTDENSEVVIINRRVEKLRKELQRQASNALLVSELRSMASHSEEDQYEAQIREDELKKVPRLGDNGVAVILQGEEAKQAEELMKIEAFNIVLSDKIPYSRKLPDARNPK
jgi:hypothetical protein